MTIKYFVSFLLCLLFMHTSFAQNGGDKKRLEDSLKQKLQKDSARIFRTTIAKPYSRIENRNSFITSEKVNLLGFMLGATFYDKHTFAVGYYFLGRDPTTIRSLRDNLRDKELMELSYINFSYIHVLINKRFLQINIPFEVGLGKYRLKNKDTLNPEPIYLTGDIVPFNAGVQFIFKPVRWAGLSTTGGYRYVRQGELDFSLRGWYYSVGVWLDMRHLIRMGRYYAKKRTYNKKIMEIKN
jgi:hypothetical protein